MRFHLDLPLTNSLHKISNVWNINTAKKLENAKASNILMIKASDGGFCPLLIMR